MVQPWHDYRKNDERDGSGEWVLFSSVDLEERIRARHALQMTRRELNRMSDRERTEVIMVLLSKREAQP